MSSIIDQHRHLTATIRDFNQSLMATLKDPRSFSYLNPKNATALNFEMDEDDYVNYFCIRTPEGRYYNMACKAGVTAKEAHTICEKYQIICMLC